MTAIDNFMGAVLGEAAYAALQKAGERSRPLAAVIGPRTVMGWANLAARWDYEGTIPGHEDSLLQFTKSATGLTGSIAMDDTQMDFENAAATNLAAILCVQLGCQPDLSKSEGATQVAIAKLGETIDLMVKARVVSLLKSEPVCKKCHCAMTKGKCPKCMDKAELPGKAAGAIAPKAPVAQQAPVPTAPKRMATRAPSVSMTKSQSTKKCSVCGSAQFTSSGDWKACYCLRELAKSVNCEPTETGYDLTFGDDWSPSHIKLLMDIVGE